MHSIRFCRRCDTGPSSICADGIEELPTSSPHPGDIIMVCKMKMSDAEPFKTMVVMSASEASALRLGCRQPLGNVERRRLGDDILKNIKSYAPRCAQQGDISEKAKTYLEKWSLCTWPRLPRPSAYSFLNFRQRTACAYIGVGVAPKWETPARFKNIFVHDGKHADNDDDDDDGCNDDEILVPIPN